MLLRSTALMFTYLPSGTLRCRWSRWIHWSSRWMSVAIWDDQNQSGCWIHWSSRSMSVAIWDYQNRRIITSHAWNTVIFSLYYFGEEGRLKWGIFQVILHNWAVVSFFFYINTIQCDWYQTSPGLRIFDSLVCDASKPGPLAGGARRLKMAHVGLSRKPLCGSMQNR